MRCECCGRPLENSGMTCYRCLGWCYCVCGTKFCTAHQYAAIKDHKCPNVTVISPLHRKDQPK